MARTYDQSFLAFDISTNISETPEGFLICHNVPIARVGTQKYLGQEIGEKDKYNQEVTVYRLHEDVFHPDTLASFEGKPLTDDHPSQEVNPSNQSAYSKGHIQNVRQQGDYIIADLFVTDGVLISKIKNKVKREVSAGYSCDYEEFQDGYRQRDITANHVAVVEKGRAGPKVSIKDSIGVKPKPMNKQQALIKMLAAFAKDASSDEVEQVTALVFDAAATSEVKPASEQGLLKKLLSFMAKDEESKKEEEEEESEKDKKSKDKKSKDSEERLKALEDSMDELMDKRSKDKKSKDKKGKDSEEEEAKEIIDELLEEGKDSDPDCEEDEEAEPEEEKKDKSEDRKRHKDTALTDIVRNLKPVMAKLPKAQQQAVKDALVKSMTGRGSSRGVYADIQRASQAKVKDSISDDDGALGKSIAAKYNPHYKTAG